MITGLQDAIAYLRRHGAGWEIAGHRDDYATECPGDLLYGHVLNGTLNPGVLWDGGHHVVKAGETLGEISLKYNVPKAYIIMTNDDLQGDGKVVKGMKLWIPPRGVPLKETAPPDDATEFQPFPGTAWFHTRPNSPIITAMGQRLVAEGCSHYSTGPGPQWTEADRASYREWQRKLGFTGDAADGWPGNTSWEQLRVPYVGQEPGDFEPFPGAAWFHTAPNSPVITAMGKRLVAEGCGEYTKGPGPQWTEADRKSYANWQRRLGFTGDAADGWPGQISWQQLQVPRS
ncbi:peptidoglycan-binding protein [Streptomyces sp. KR80]|uniref:peptidoglycan-binding protein n=1 Tax=Streptomyces sp. KR80 TaxID=3457426 RepID=UPI003FD471FF